MRESCPAGFAGRATCIESAWTSLSGMSVLVDSSVWIDHLRGVPNRKTAVLDLLLEEKRLLARAAYERLDVTSFIMRNVLPAAREVVDRAERIVLSERDSVRVLQLLEHPPEPTPALIAAARRRAART